MIDWNKAIRSAHRVQAAQADARKLIKAKRDEMIGTPVYVSGVAVGTDDTTQMRLTGTAVAAMMDPNYTVSWKMLNNEFIQLNAQQVIAMAQAVRCHVQACFNREAVLVAANEHGHIISVEDGWPTDKVRLRDGHAVATKVGTGIYRVEVPGKKWEVLAPEGFTANVSHDGVALSVWLWRDGSLTDLESNQYATLRVLDEV